VFGQRKSCVPKLGRAGYVNGGQLMSIAVAKRRVVVKTDVPHRASYGYYTLSPGLLARPVYPANDNVAVIL